MSLWNIINPSDPYTLRADDLDVAFCVCAFLGMGKYALREIGGAERYVPADLFGGYNAWCQETFLCSVDELFGRVMREKRDAVIASLDSVVVGNPTDRAAHEKGLALIDDPAKHAEWKAAWHDDRRSSTNDIGAQAQSLAKQIRKEAK